MPGSQMESPVWLRNKLLVWTDPSGLAQSSAPPLGCTRPTLAPASMKRSAVSRRLIQDPGALQSAQPSVADRSHIHTMPAQDARHSMHGEKGFKPPSFPYAQPSFDLTAMPS